MSPAVAAAAFQDGEGTYSRSTTRAGGKRVRRQGGTATRTEVLLPLDQWPCAGRANGRVNEVQKTACCLSTDVEEPRHRRTCQSDTGTGTEEVRCRQPATGVPRAGIFLCRGRLVFHHAARRRTGSPQARSSKAGGDSCGRASVWGRTKYECSRAKRPRSAAWLAVSVNTSQAEPGTNFQKRFGPFS